MKKYLALLCASMLCVCCLALAACGGSASSSSAAASGSDSAASASAASEAATSSAAASSSAAAVDPQQLFAGDWKIAGLETQGVTMSGDLSAVLGESEVILTLNADGTASFTMGDEAMDGAWKVTGDTAADLTINEQTVPLSYEDDAVLMTMESEDFSGTMILTKDGTYAKLPAITSEGAKAITSEDALIGNWSLCGMNMMGISMNGDSASLAAVAGDTDMTMNIEKGGSATLMGEEATWAIDADGASITLEGTTLPVQALDNGNLIMDMTDLLGGMSMIMVFSK